MTSSSDFAWMPLAAVKPWRRNPRKNERAVKPVAESLRRFGFVSPVVIWPGGDRLVAGHTRLKALEMLLKADPGFVPRGAPGPGVVPVRFQEFSNEAEADAYALADNKLGEIASWDEAALPEILKEIRQSDAELLKVAGWSDAELTRLLRDPDAGDEDVDSSDALRAKWKTEAGQLWEIPSRTTPGRAHRVLCGDSTDPAAVSRIGRGQIMVSDPPYGVEYDPTWREGVGGQIDPGPRVMRGWVCNDDQADWSSAWALWGADVAYIWHASMMTATVANQLDGAKYQRRANIIWRKQHFLLSRGDYHWQHEPCWYAVKNGSRSGWCGDRTQSTIWDIANMNPMGGDVDGDNERTGHGTQKPLECMARPIRNHFEPGAIVVDPFLGSGTTLVAAEREKRICHGMELSPAYVAVILERCAKLGLEPRLS